MGGGEACYFQQTKLSVTKFAKSVPQRKEFKIVATYVILQVIILNVKREQQTQQNCSLYSIISEVCWGETSSRSRDPNEGSQRS